MANVRRVYAEKKPAYAVRAEELMNEIKEYLNIQTVSGVRVLVRYDVENVSEETYKKALVTVFSEPPVDYVYEESFEMNEGDKVFSVEYLPGQFDQRADSAAQCIQIISQGNRPIIRTAKVYVLAGELTQENIAAIKKHVINAVESREASLELPETLAVEYDAPQSVATVDGFISLDEELYQKIIPSSDAINAVIDEIELTKHNIYYIMVLHNYV